MGDPKLTQANHLDHDNENASIEGWIEPGSLYWSKNPSETFWVSMVMPDPETGLTCRRYHEDKTAIWSSLACCLYWKTKS